MQAIYARKLVVTFTAADCRRPKLAARRKINKNRVNLIPNTSSTTFYYAAVYKLGNF